MKKLFLVALVFTSFFAVSQQTQQNNEQPFEKNTIYGEAFGQGLGGSISYDRLFNQHRKIMNSHTLGFTFIPKQFEFGDGRYIGGHYSYNFIFGKKSHHLELGLGVTALFVKNFGGYNSLYTYLTPKLGYRFQHPTGGLFFRVTATPMVALANVNFSYFDGGKTSLSLFKNVADMSGSPVFFWPGVSLGYSFK